MPFRYGVTLPRHSLVSDLINEISSLTGIQTSRIHVADVFRHNIFEIFNEKRPVSNIQQNDFLAAYEVDPYTESSIHAVVNHCFMATDQNGQRKRIPFGFPFMTSFDAGATCRQTWEHLWDIVDHLVRQEGSDEGYVDRSGKYPREAILDVRCVNGRGEELNVFPDEDGNPTALLPFDSSIEIRQFLGDSCTENFVFFALQWENPTDLDEDEDKLVDPNAFMAYADHKTLVEAAKKHKASLDRWSFYIKGVSQNLGESKTMAATEIAKAMKAGHKPVIKAGKWGKPRLDLVNPDAPSTKTNDNIVTL